MKKLLVFLFLLFSLVHIDYAKTASKNPTSDEAISGTWDGSTGTRYTVVNDHPDSAGSTFLTHGTVTCVASGTDITFVAVTANNTLNAGELLRFDTSNAVSPETDEYSITVGWTE